MQEIRNKIDPEAVRSRLTNTPYPHMYITDINKCVPIVVSALEEGDLALLGTYKGDTRIIKTISKSALNVHKLLRVTDLEIRFSASDISSIKSVIEYMEVAQRWT